MIRRSKLALLIVILLFASPVLLAYTGLGAPFVTPSMVPGSAIQGAVAVAGLVVVGLAVSVVMDRMAWTRTGRQVGLESEGARLVGNPPGGDRELLPAPVLSGSVRDRDVRARTYTVSTGSGDSGSSTTYSVVETELSTPVEWTGLFAAGAGAQFDDLAQLGSMESKTVDGGYSVAGEAPADVAEAVLGDQRVRDALDAAEGPVAVGDVTSAVVGAMSDSLEGSSGMGGSLAQGMLSLAEDGDSGPSQWVRFRSEGLLLDADTMEQRGEAVAAVAEAVERVAAGR